jgi:hypothetical protein
MRKLLEFHIKADISLIKIYYLSDFKKDLQLLEGINTILRLINRQKSIQEENIYRISV